MRPDFVQLRMGHICDGESTGTLLCRRALQMPRHCYSDGAVGGLNIGLWIVAPIQRQSILFARAFSLCMITTYAVGNGIGSPGKSVGAFARFRYIFRDCSVAHS